ncbi:MAG: sel1 repeat family protein [Alphaproteobacteria bacterium]|nr:sel1 repeat family protein [Alphaproteobacteria bacterium]
MPQVFLAAFLALILATGSPAAGPIEDADKAVENGDLATAFRLYSRAAASGNAMAQYHLGLMYEKGEGVPRDYQTAIRWLRLAAGQGLAMAQFSLGDIYAAGQGVARDVVEAERWYRQAAVQGDAKSQYSIGVMYAIGVGLPRDMILAYVWFELAAALGDVNGAAARERMEYVMTEDELVRGQKLARQCLASGYTECVEPPILAPESA